MKGGGNTKNAGIPPITNLMVSLTNQCTMRCPFCFVDREVTRMGYETMMKTAQFLIRNSEQCGVPPRMVFFGGEPTLEWDTLIVPITRYIREEYCKPFVLSMTTNMTLLNEERVRFLVENQIQCLFSVDGGRETMTINRPMADGSDSFALVDRSIDLIVRNVPHTAARITLYEPTVGNFYKDLRYVESKGFRSVSVLPNLFSDWSTGSVEAFKAQLVRYGDHLIESFRAGVTPAVFQQYGECFYKMMLAERCAGNGLYQTLSKCQACGKCGFGLGHHATMDYAGNIYGCLHPGPLTPESIFYLGNIEEGVDPERTVRLVRMCEEETPGGLDCPGCKLRHICDRGCAPNNYICNGTFTTPPAMFCHYYRALMDDAQRVSTVLGGERNEASRVYFQRRVMEG